MATPNPRSRRSGTRQRVTYNRDEPGFQTVDPRFLLRALPLVVLAAFLCAYLMMCVLFALGSWQLVLHPTHTGHGFIPSAEAVRFGPDAGGQPQLAGALLRASDSRETGMPTVLYLRPGDGELGDADQPLIAMLHELRLDVFSFDYRGAGHSAERPHPNQARMQEDADAAWQYLTGLHGVAPRRIVIYGAGVGASLAARLAQQHPEAGALILRNASADVLETVMHESRSRVFPVRLLFHDRFPLTGLETLKMPKLLLDIGPADQGLEERARSSAYHSAADPKMTVELPTPNPERERESLKRFLDSQLETPPGMLKPAGAK